MWVICGIISILISVVIKAIKSTSSNKFYHECFNADAFLWYVILLCGGALIVYVLMILVGFFGLCLMVLGSFIVFACWFAENVSTSKKIGHGLYKLLRRKKRDD